MKPLYVLKIGGSIITEKDEVHYSKVRTELLQEIFTNLRAPLLHGDFRLILISGAGGHLHHLAHTHALKTGLTGERAQTIGALQTRAACQRLAADIADIALAADIPLCTVQAGAVVEQTQNKISSMHIRSIENALKQDMVPLLGGDIVFDEAFGMSICSGDSTGSQLCSQLPVAKLFFATDVDGVCTTDPKRDPDATLITDVCVSDVQKNYQLESSGHAHDTTDGLRGKVQAFEKLFTQTSTLKEVHIFNGLESGNYTKALADTPFPHTVFTP